MNVLEYMEAIKSQFKYYKFLGNATFDQLNDEQLFWQFNTESNSIAIIVNHISGNMLSRWTDFLTSDGEKKWRNRDKEFEDILKSRDQLIEVWEGGWSCLFTALSQVNQENFGNIVYIRNEGHTVQEAINRQLAHYAYHVGQITYIGRMMKSKEWKSLSIPKGESKKFNMKYGI